MANHEQAPHQHSQEHAITIFAGDDQHPVRMACYDQERFYIGGLRAQLEAVIEESIVFALTVETGHQGWVTCVMFRQIG